jgi:hypothetical protein
MADEAIIKYFKGNEETLFSYLDVIHDFKILGMEDKPTIKHGDPPGRIHYWEGFAFSILRRGMGGNPHDSFLFNGCSRGKKIHAHAEKLGLKLAISYGGIGETKKIDYKSETPGAFYVALAEVLAPFKQNGRIPLVVDTASGLRNDSHNLREMNTVFAVCKNREVYADPSITSRCDFKDAECIEVTKAARIYTEGAKRSMPLYVIIEGPMDNIRTTYMGIDNTGKMKTYLTEEHKQSLRFRSNSRTNSAATFKSLLHTKDFYSNNIDYCAALHGNKEFTNEGPWGDSTLLRTMAIHLMKKRHGDQFQVRSCAEPINYRHKVLGEVEFGGREKPCVFWSVDQLAIAFAIFLGIPCVYQLANKNVTVYLPSKKNQVQEGGACTRQDLKYTLKEIVGEESTSTQMMDLINGNQECLKRYVELHLEVDKVQYSPMYIIYILKMKAPKGIIPESLFTEEFLYNHYNKYAQLYIEGDSEDATVEILNKDPRILFFSLKYKLYIYLDGSMIVVSKMDATGSSKGGEQIYAFSKFILTSDDLIEEDNSGGVLTPQKNPFLNLLQRMKQVENYMVVFPDSRESFMSESKTHFIEQGGYTSYEIVLFFRAAVELFELIEDKAQFSKAFHGVFDTLNVLGETELSREILLFLNTFVGFQSRAASTQESQLIIGAILKVAKVYIEEAQNAMESFGFDENKMIKFLDTNFPLGTLGRYYDHAVSVLQAYNTKVLVNPEISLAHLKQRNRKTPTTHRKSHKKYSKTILKHNAQNARSRNKNRRKSLDNIILTSKSSRRLSRFKNL